MIKKVFFNFAGLCLFNFPFSIGEYPTTFKREPEINYATAIFSDVEADFSGRDMSFYCFNQSILIAVNFKGSDVRYSSFERASLWKVNFEGTDLINVNFENSKLIKVNFNGSDLTGANFKGAILKDVDFRGAILSPTCILPIYKSQQEIKEFYINSTKEDKKILSKIFDIR